MKSLTLHDVILEMNFHTLVSNAEQVNLILDEYRNPVKVSEEFMEQQKRILDQFIIDPLGILIFSYIKYTTQERFKLICKLAEECCDILNTLENQPRMEKQLKFVNEHPNDNDDMDLDFSIDSLIFSVTYIIWGARVEHLKDGVLELNKMVDFFHIYASTFDGEYGNQYTDGTLIRDMSVEELRRRYSRTW